MMMRREFARTVLAAFPVYALLAECRPAGAASGTAARRWIMRQDDLARALLRDEVSLEQWRREVAALSLSVDIEQLMAEIDRSLVQDVGRGQANDPFKRSILFRDETGTPQRLHYAAALFGFERHNVITPHAHRHMVSAHLVVEGAFRVRNFDRVRNEDGAVIIRPSIDETITVGEVSTIGRERDNIHWFVPRSERAVAFDIIVSGLDEDAPRYVIEAVDPVRGTPLPDGTVRAPILDFAEAGRFYTADL